MTMIRPVGAASLQPPLIVAGTHDLPKGQSPNEGRREPYAGHSENYHFRPSIAGLSDDRSAGSCSILIAITSQKRCPLTRSVPIYQAALGDRSVIALQGDLA